MTSQHSSGLPPSSLVSSHDLARREALLDSPRFNKHPAATALSDELGRARVLPPDQIPGDVVTMHSRIALTHRMRRPIAWRTADAHSRAPA